MTLVLWILSYHMKILRKRWTEGLTLHNGWHSLEPPFLKGGGVNFDYLPQREGESEKLKKGGGSMVQGQVVLKGGRGWCNFFYIIFSRFVSFTFRNYFTLCKIVLCIWRKIIFFCHHNFRKKGNSKLSKNERENIP